jgi:signal transduction histidine kinase/ActR/RegA family two-component response regulator
MSESGAFDVSVWAPALEKFGAATRLSVALYDAAGAAVVAGVPATPIFTALESHGRDSGVIAGCVRLCLAQRPDHRPPVVVTLPSGLALVGVSLLLDGRIVGVTTAAYALVGFCDSVGIARLARESGTPFQELWAVARGQAPIPARRLILDGELLQVLGDTLLRENQLRRRSEETSVQLTASAAAKEEFLAVLSHELRTPLTPILGWTSILKLASEPRVVHAAEVIERNALLQIRLVEDLLELTRATRGKLVLNLKTHCMSDPVRAAIDALADDARKKNITVEFIDAPEPLCICADTDRLQQILRNILVNALKFTPIGGAATVTLAREGDSAVLCIRDTGEGIAADFLPFVFEMFQQQEQGTRRRHPGLGIGLALVKQLTEAHDGTVTVTSPGEGRGTEVTLRLPLDPGTLAVAVPHRSRTGDDASLEGLRILVVEDMEDALEMLAVTLENFGAKVVTARDGMEALGKVADDDVDLVLCDLRMPRMDGFEFLRALRGLDGHTHPPVIAVSGLSSSADHLATEAAGFTGHVDKPFDDSSLLAAVGVAMAHRAR